MRSIIVLFMVLLISTPISFAQIPANQEKNDQVYYGYDYGAAGIVDSLLEYYKISKDSAVLHTITVGLDSIWDNRLVENGTQYPLWTKLDGGDIYSGIKYGSAGIIKTLIHAYEILGNETYLNWAEQSMNHLYNQYLGDLPHWGYAYANATTGAGGIPITDYRYGSIGIIETMLDVYLATGNERYLQMADNSTEWLFSNMLVKNNNSYGVLPWFVGDNSERTSLYEGNAGLVHMLSRLSGFVDRWNGWLEFLLWWFASVQNGDGSWDYNIAKQGVQLTTLDIGVAGILVSLLPHYSRINSTIIGGYGWLDDQFIINSTHVLMPKYPEDTYGKTSFYEGVAGTLFSYSKYFSVNSKDIPIEKVKGTIRWLLDNATLQVNIGSQRLKGFAPSSINFEYIDLSVSDGNAGIMLSLLELRKSGLSTYLENDKKVNQVIGEIVQLLISTQRSDGLWSKQVAEYVKHVNVLLIGVGILIPVLIYLIYRSRRD